MDAVRADRLLPGIVEKRSAGPRRCSTSPAHCGRDTEVSGQAIARATGDDGVIAANHDPAHFDDPRFEAPPNLAFGAGAHQCLGLHLARLEMRILFEVLLDQIETVELASRPRGPNRPSSAGSRRCRCALRLTGRTATCAAGPASRWRSVTFGCLSPQAWVHRECCV